MFPGRNRESDPEPSEVYDGLRRQVLDLDPAEAGLEPSPDLPHVWGLVMETGYARGVATLVALADGTTSLYFSTGGGIIGGGVHPRIANATRALLDVVEQHIGQMPVSTHTALPAVGRTALRAMTYQGQRAVEAGEEELGRRMHPQSDVFHAAHAVITELRLVDEARSAP